MEGEDDQGCGGDDGDDSGVECDVLEGFEPDSLRLVCRGWGAQGGEDVVGLGPELHSF